MSRKNENVNGATKFEKARGFVRKNWSSKNFNPKSNPLAEDTSSSGTEEEELAKVIGGKQGGSSIHKKKSARFTPGTKMMDDDEEEDFLLDDDNEAEDDFEQLEKMKKLEADRLKKGLPPRAGGLKSAFSKRDNISSATTRIVDLTEDQISYGIRPSTAI